jgi:hypothetical protein
VTPWVPESCTLPTADRPLRVAEFDGLFAGAVRRPSRLAPGRLEVLLPAEAEPVARDLAARETACCSFFTFTLRPGQEGVALTVEVPPAHVAVLDAVEQRAEAVRTDHDAVFTFRRSRVRGSSTEAATSQISPPNRPTGSSG